jgi:UDP-N-acetylglucosamine:LPS N-acetylglucosamine transferase
MHILLHIFGGEGGGVATYNRTFVRKFMDEGHRVSVLSNGKGRHFDELSKITDVHLVDVPSYVIYPWFLFKLRLPNMRILFKIWLTKQKAVPKINNILRRIKPDLIVTNGPQGAVYVNKAAKKNSLPVFPILHGFGTSPEDDIANIRAKLSCREEF